MQQGSRGSRPGGAIIEIDLGRYPDQRLYRLPHEVIDADRVLEARVLGAWPDLADESELLDAVEASESGG
jgi:hypothetical protein